MPGWLLPIITDSDHAWGADREAAGLAFVGYCSYDDRTFSQRFFEQLPEQRILGSAKA